MNPLEAMAKAIYERICLGQKWEDASPGGREVAFEIARAALNALADNVDARFVRFDFSTNASKLDESRLRGFIRTAGEE